MELRGHLSSVTSSASANHCQSQDTELGISASVGFDFRFTLAFIGYDHLSQIMAHFLRYNQSLKKVFSPIK
jgi:hypothetical protein